MKYFKSLFGIGNFFSTTRRLSCTKLVRPHSTVFLVKHCEGDCDGCTDSDCETTKLCC